MTIYSTWELKDGLLPHLDYGRKLDCVLSVVGEIETAGVQVLLLLKREVDQATGEGGEPGDEARREGEALRSRLVAYLGAGGGYGDRHARLPAGR